MNIKLLNKKINKIIDDSEKKKSEEIISLLENSLPKKILDFDLKRVEMFDLVFGDYEAIYEKKNSQIEMSLFITIPIDGTNGNRYNVCIYDSDGADFSSEVRSFADLDNSASDLILFYNKEKRCLCHKQKK